MQGTPSDATGLLGRRGCCRLLSLSAGAHKVRDLGTFSTDKHCGKCPRAPCERSSIPLVPWQIGLPLGQVLTCYLSVLGRWAFLPLLPSLSSMQEHLMQDDRPVRSSQLPPWVLIEEEFSIYPPLSFSHQESHFPGLLPGSLGLQPSSIMQLQQNRVTKETIKT